MAMIQYNDCEDTHAVERGHSGGRAQPLAKKIVNGGSSVLRGLEARARCVRWAEISGAVERGGYAHAVRIQTAEKA